MLLEKDTKIKREKQKGKKSSPPWPAGRRKTWRSPAECLPLGILSGGMGALPAISHGNYMFLVWFGFLDPLRLPVVPALKAVSADGSTH